MHRGVLGLAYRLVEAALLLIPPTRPSLIGMDTFTTGTLDLAPILPAMTDFRHHLHQIPELLYEEFQTAAAIRTKLDQLGIACLPGPANARTATIAVLGDPQKPCIALRADIDALPITETTGLPYASRHPGRMHACGHDGHTATLMGVAAALAKHAQKLPVCVKLIWQPAEECGGGAGRLVQAGVLDGRLGPKVSAIFGLHGWPGLPVGLVATKPGALLAAVDGFSATFIGKGCHAAFPHLGADPIAAACNAVVELQQIASREIDPTEPVVVTVAQINAGTTTNVIPDTATFAGTVRTVNDQTRTYIKQAVIRRCQSAAASGRCTVKVNYDEGYPATINDPTMAQWVADSARTALGEKSFMPVARPTMGGEDFSYYLQKVPGCFFFIGVEPPGMTSYPSLHSDHYDFTDAALAVGMKMFLALIDCFAGNISRK